MSIRAKERESIIKFLEYAAEEGIFRGAEVLDYGCGEQPYRELIEKAGAWRYQGYDLPVLPGSTVFEPVQEPGMFDRRWDVIVTTQTVQYVPDVAAFLLLLHGLLEDDGKLVITWPTNWPEVEDADLHRFTQSGMRNLLVQTFKGELTIKPRAFIEVGSERLYLGHGAIAWK